MATNKRRRVASGDRPSCKYGAKCYRKNPEHLARFRHPVLNINGEADAHGGAGSGANQDAAASVRASAASSDSSGVPTDSPIEAMLELKAFNKENKIVRVVFHPAKQGSPHTNCCVILLPGAGGNPDQAGFPELATALAQSGLTTIRMTLKNASAQYPSRRAALVLSLMDRLCATVLLRDKRQVFAQRFIFVTCSNGGRVACNVWLARKRAIMGLIMTGYPCVSGSNPTAPPRKEYEHLLSNDAEADYSNIIFVRSMKDKMAPDTLFDQMIDTFAPFKPPEPPKQRQTLYQREPVGSASQATGSGKEPIILEAAGSAHTMTGFSFVVEAIVQRALVMANATAVTA